MPAILGEYFELQRGATYKSAMLGQAGPVLLGLGSIARNGGFKGDNLKTYGGPCDPRHLLTPGDIYVSLKDVTQSADLLGAVARVPSYIPLGRLTQDTVKLVFKQEDAPRKYLYWLLQTPQYREYCRAHSTGTTNLGLARDDFLNFEVPPLTRERQWIVDLVQTIEDKIELNRRINETLERMAQAIYRDWFVDFGPTRRKVTGGLDPVAIMGGVTPDSTRAAQLAALFPAALADEGLPMGWTAGTLNRLALVNPESWKTKNHPAQVEYVDLSNTKWGTIEATASLTWDAAPSRARRIVRVGDTIVGTVRPGNGSFAYIGRDGYTASTGFAVLRPKQAIYTDAIYVAATAADNIARLANLADGHGGAYPAVNPDVVGDTSFPVVRDELLAAFSVFATPLRAKVEQAKLENQTLAETRDHLLPRLISGTVRVAPPLNETER
jgi:type I restriction enzyme S subunit